MTDKQIIIVRRQETVVTAWVRDASTMAFLVAMIGIGILAQSAAMQWVGAIFGFLSICIYASGKNKEHHFDIEGAQRRLDEIKAEMGG